MLSMSQSPNRRKGMNNEFGKDVEGRDHDLITYFPGGTEKND
jgi:hypothetical protein